MKKTISLLLLLSLLCLCACSGSAQDAAPSASPEPAASAEAPSTPSPSPSAAPEAAGFEPCADLSVLAAYVYDGDTYVLVENTGERPILSFSLAYINFDKNGFPTTTDRDGYDSGRAEAVNLMPGEKNIFSWYGASGSYALAVITGVDYADGSDWSAAGLNGWAQSARSGFDADKYAASVEALGSDGALAEACEYASLTEVYINHGNQFSSSHDLHFSVQNTGALGITKLTLFVLEFDENGFPVSVRPYDTCCLNGHKTGGAINLAAGESGSYEDSLFISPTTTQIKTAIAHLEFQDGSEWDNPYIYEWLISGCGAY